MLVYKHNKTIQQAEYFTIWLELNSSNWYSAGAECEASVQSISNVMQNNEGISHFLRFD
jgi:hypothetical protein